MDLGLKKGDVITELDGKLLEDDLRFRQFLLIEYKEVT